MPSLLHVAQDYTKGEVAVIIRNGKLPPSQDAMKPPPPQYMQSWKSVLANEIVECLWSLQPKKADSW